ncbi:mitochondrial sodium/calcium exchanger protein-like [Schistocerca serialis cubense]|uniref:mitochondrial sodium/calcium exchanger protein-like n=1 Tax=Schistocerca serialis cubense TaxID=2023355 RepID=UPI00214F371F|nr:mitochondrial sodium/calcium exchanger protein-like [Schistocerca serialis cubense]
MLFKLSPFFIALKLIIPSVDDNDENLGWIKPIHTLNCVTLPVYGSYVSGIASKDLSFGIPVVLPVTIIASALSAYVYFTSEIEKPPPYFNVFAFLGFFGSVVTIYLIATETVSLLRAAGLVCHISEGTLGMTVLAWGNCLGGNSSSFTYF